MLNKFFKTSTVAGLSYLVINCSSLVNAEERINPGTIQDTNNWSYILARQAVESINDKQKISSTGNINILQEIDLKKVKEKRKYIENKDLVGEVYNDFNNNLESLGNGLNGSLSRVKMDIHISIEEGVKLDLWEMKKSQQEGFLTFYHFDKNLTAEASPEKGYNLFLKAEARF